VGVPAAFVRFNNASHCSEAQAVATFSCLLYCNRLRSCHLHSTNLYCLEPVHVMVLRYPGIPPLSLLQPIGGLQGLPVDALETILVRPASPLLDIMSQGQPDVTT
jgi:hypothetical protein